MARKNAFTLVESLIALVIFSMIMTSLGFGVNILSHKLDDQYQLRIYRLANYLENPNHHFIVNQIETNQVEIEDWKNKKTFILKQQNNQLRLIGDSGGMIPLIGDVEDASFSQKKGILTVDLNHNGKNFQQELLISQK